MNTGVKTANDEFLVRLLVEVKSYLTTQPKFPLTNTILV